MCPAALVEIIEKELGQPFRAGDRAGEQQPAGDDVAEHERVDGGENPPGQGLGQRKILFPGHPPVFESPPHMRPAAFVKVIEDQLGQPFRAGDRSGEEQPAGDDVAEDEGVGGGEDPPGQRLGQRARLRRMGRFLHEIDEHDRHPLSLLRSNRHGLEFARTSLCELECLLPGWGANFFPEIPAAQTWLVAADYLRPIRHR